MGQPVASDKWERTFAYVPTYTLDCGFVFFKTVWRRDIVSDIGGGRLALVSQYLLFAPL